VSITLIGGSKALPDCLRRAYARQLNVFDELLTLKISYIPLCLYRVSVDVDPRTSDLNMTLPARQAHADID